MTRRELADLVGKLVSAGAVRERDGWYLRGELLGRDAATAWEALQARAK